MVSFTRRVRIAGAGFGVLHATQLIAHAARLLYFIRSTPPSRLNTVGLKCASARPSVRPSTESCFDLHEIWYVGIGRRVMHDGMQYDPVQG